jgi:hypothetical protein
MSKLPKLKGEEQRVWVTPNKYYMSTMSESYKEMRERLNLEMDIFKYHRLEYSKECRGIFNSNRYYTYTKEEGATVISKKKYDAYWKRKLLIEAIKELK